MTKQAKRTKLKKVLKALNSKEQKETIQATERKVVSFVELVKDGVNSRKLTQALREIKGAVVLLRRSSKLTEKQFGSLNRDLSELQRLVSKVEGLPRVEEKTLDELESRLTDLVKSSVEGLKLPQDDDKTEKTLNTLSEDIKRLRSEFLAKLGALGAGGQANREIRVNSSVVSVRYADIDLFAGSNITLTKTDNDTDRNARITITASDLDKSAIWGSITGTLSDQTDLQDELNLKATSSNLSGSYSTTSVIVGTYATTSTLLGQYVTPSNLSGTYATEADLTTAEAETATKAAQSTLALYAPLASPSFTGGINVGGSIVGFVNGYPTASTLTGSYPTTSTVTGTYATTSTLLGEYTTPSNLGGTYITTSTASGTYKTKPVAMGELTPFTSSTFAGTLTTKTGTASVVLSTAPTISAPSIIGGLGVTGVTGITAQQQPLTLVNTTVSAGANLLNIKHLPSDNVTSANDTANILFTQWNDSSIETGYADIRGIASVVTDSTEEGQLNLRVVEAGTLKSIVTLKGGGASVVGNLGATTIGGITEANLVDKADTEAISGAWTFGNVLTVASTLNLGSSPNLTIASDVITKTGSYHTIDTENSDPTDNLSSILGGSEGDVLVIRTNVSTRDVTVLDNGNAGGGNILLVNNASVLLDNNQDNLGLMHFGAFWVELFRNNTG